MPHPHNDRRRTSDYFLTREKDGTVRLRIRFTGDEASMMEEAAGSTPVLDWITETLRQESRRQVQDKRAQRRPLRSPRRPGSNEAPPGGPSAEVD